MATWQETKSFIQSNFNVEVLDGDIIKMVFETEGGRSQLIFVHHYDLLNGAAFFSPFAKISDISGTQFAGLAKDSVLGLSEHFDMYGALHVAPLDNLDMSEISWPLQWVTHYADMLEKQLGLGDSL